MAIGSNRKSLRVSHLSLNLYLSLCMSRPLCYVIYICLNGGGACRDNFYERSFI